MRAAAGRQVEALDLDQPQRAAADRLLPQLQRRRFLAARVADGDRPILPDDPIRLALGCGDFIRRHLARQVDGRRRDAKMEAQRAHLKQVLERG